MREEIPSNVALQPAKMLQSNRPHSTNEDGHTTESFDGKYYAPLDFGYTELTSIGDSAFEGTATTQFDLSKLESCTIGIAAFRNCQRLLQLSRLACLRIAVSSGK